MSEKKNILLLTQYFYPATVIASKLYFELAQDLVKNGFDVTVYTSNRCHITEDEIPGATEEKDGIHIVRFDIPKVTAKLIARFVQSYCMQKRIRAQFRREQKRFDAAIVCSHPVFSYFLFSFFKKTQKDIKILYWCFDLYPDAIITLGGALGKLFHLTRPFVSRALNRADAVVDLGVCMRKRLRAYTSVRNETLTPWALVEEKELRPVSLEEKERVFGKHKFFLIFSGSITFGRDLDVFIEFVRYCRERGLDVALCIAGFGHFAEQLKQQYHDCTDYVVFLNYCDETELRRRLSAADVHLLSFEDRATGCAVPSKFFAALGVGRPVLAAVSPESCIARWIEEYQIGALLRKNEYEKPFQFVKKMFDDPDFARKTQTNALDAYHREFSREVVVTRWIKLIEETTKD